MYILKIVFFHLFIFTLPDNAVFNAIIRNNKYMQKCI